MTLAQSADRLQSLSALQLSDLAGLPYAPRANTSDGGAFLLTVHSLALDAIREGYDADESAREVTRAAVPVGSQSVMFAVAELGAFTLDLSDIAESVDLVDLGVDALTVAGRTLAAALFEWSDQAVAGGLDADDYVLSVTA
jgi:hypothetical protein